MTNERSKAYGRVIRTLRDLGPTKLLPAEQARIRDVADPSRDPCRTPMPWTRDGGWESPWLPLEDTSRNVEDQRADPESTLLFTRDLIALRKQLADLGAGDYAELPSPPGTWATWRSGRRAADMRRTRSSPTACGRSPGASKLLTSS